MYVFIEVSMNKVKYLSVAFIFLILVFGLNAQTASWMWALGLGGYGSDNVNDLETDSAGNSYVTGTIRGSATIGNTTITSTGDLESAGFIGKLDNAGSWLWVIQIGENGYSGGSNLALDSNDNLYVVGFADTTLTFNGVIPTGSGSKFIAKLTCDGVWQWVTRTSHPVSLISADSYGNSYVSGSIPMYKADTITKNSMDRFGLIVLKVTNWGQIEWTQSIGSPTPTSIVTDPNGYSYILGSFYESATFGTTTLTSASTDLNGTFIAKIDNSGNWVWAISPTNCGGYGLAIGANGYIYVSGSFYYNSIFGNTTLSSSFEENTFVAKLSSGGEWIWATQAASSYWNRSTSISVNNNGECFVTGIINGFTTFGSVTFPENNSPNVYLAKLNSTGGWLWVDAFVVLDVYPKISMDNSDNCYLAGRYYNYNFFIGDHLIHCNGNYDFFVCKYGTSSSNVDEINTTTPAFASISNFPNPFTQSTKFIINLKESTSNYELSIYDLRGRRVTTINTEELSNGVNSLSWFGVDSANCELPSGIYFYQLSNGVDVITRKMIILRD